MAQSIKVKICGVRTVEHAIVAAQAGADYVGLMFAESPRRITKEQAKEIVQALHLVSGNQPKTVGVFVNRLPRQIEDIAKEVGFDLAQLSGDEAEEELEEFSIPLIKAVHVDPSTPGPVGLLTLKRKLTWLRQRNILPLLDSKVRGLYGGSGQSFDHGVAMTLAKDFVFLLAGGLTPANIDAAVAQVHPWGVDVSSGVETNGVKDMQKIREFLTKAKH